MYSYLHRYHAGNFADIHKHIILLAVLAALQKKDTPFCVLDAYAGEGIYDLQNAESQKNQEYQSGFGKIQRALDAPGFVQELLTIAHSYSQNHCERLIYPGSPAIINAKLRTQDQAIFIENHPAAYIQLKKHFGSKSQTHIHKRDAIESINALLPFKEKRGLIFIDPSYEIKEEYQTIIDTVQRAYSKFPQGIYMIWYPLLPAGRHTLLCTELKQKFQDIWQHEWVPMPTKERTEGLYGSGIMIINSPWNLDQTLEKDFKFLHM